jgi:prepilin-type N-terminal cleavage/methylation domain-containing protein
MKCFKRTTKLTNDAFTIVELMIAMSILAVILVMSTEIMIQIGELFSKGVNSSNLQNTSRSIAADLSSNIQFSGSLPVSCDSTTEPNTCYVPQTLVGGSYPDVLVTNNIKYNEYAICIGSTRYTFIMNAEQGYDPSKGTTVPHVLWRDTINGDGSCAPLQIKDLTIPSDSLSADANGNNSGGYDMLSDHMRLTRFIVTPLSTSGDLYDVEVWMAYGDTNLMTPVLPNGQTDCLGAKGQEFCSTTEISMTVQGRIY